MIYEFKEIEDKNKWNNFVESVALNSERFPPVTFIQSWEWMDFQVKNGNRVYRLGIFKNGELVGVSAGVVINAKRGKYLYIRNGPVIDWNNRELIAELVSHLKAWVKINDLWFIRISPLVEKNSKAEANINSFNFKNFAMHDVEALDTWIMNISNSTEEVFDSIKKKVRYEIRSAEKLGVETFITKDSKYIDDYYEILKDTVQRQGWNAYSLNYIKKEFEEFTKENRADLILMKYDNKYIAGGIFIHFANQTYYHYGASLSKYIKEVPAMYLLIWEAIKLSKEKGNKFFNFWGIAPENKPNHPWEGLTNFKMKFPGTAVRWALSKDIPVSPLYKLTNTYERIDKYRKGY